MRPVPRFEDYLVDEQGVVWGKPRADGSRVPLSQSSHGRTGHKRVRLYGPNGHRMGTRSGRFADMYVHRIVCEAFHGEPPDESTLVRHLDGNSQNNTPDNLAWGDLYENASDYWAVEGARHNREERKGIRGDHPPYQPDMLWGF